MFLNKLINKGYQADSCELCQTQFNLIKLQRIHKCKRCAKFICKQCGKNRQKIIDKDGVWTKHPHRICNRCKQDFIEIHQTINDMQWNKDTRMSKQWLSNIKKSSQTQKDYEYTHFLKLFYLNKKSHQQAVQTIDKDVIKGRTDSSVFNFSMREFFYTVKAEVQDHASRQNIKKVLYALAARYSKIGYCQGMSGVAAFLLCFSSQKTAYVLFCDLLENVYPRDFFIRSEYGVTLSGLLAESYFLQQYFFYYLTVIKKPLIQKVRGQFYDQGQLSHLRTIIELVASKALLSLFVGIVSFSNCIFIWQEIKQHRCFDVIQKAFVAIIYLNRQKILQNRSFRIVEDIFQRMDLDEFKQFYYDVQIDQQFKNQLLNEYYEGVKKKWNTKPDQQVKILEKLTNLTTKELELLRKTFPQNNGISIGIEQFVLLVNIYFKTIKEFYPKETIFQTKTHFVNRIYQNFKKNNESGLDFRQFILCFVQCTTNNIKDRICAMISTFKDQKEIVSFQNFKELIKEIEEISINENLKEKKHQFEKRILKYFQEQENIHLHQMETLLNDDFINQLCFYVNSETNLVIEKTVQLFKLEKVK